MELARFLGRRGYEPGPGRDKLSQWLVCRFALKEILQTLLEVPQDRNGRYRAKVISKSKQYEDKIRENPGFLFMRGTNAQSLSTISVKLSG